MQSLDLQGGTRQWPRSWWGESLRLGFLNGFSSAEREEFVSISGRTECYRWGWCLNEGEAVSRLTEGPFSSKTQPCPPAG